MHKLLYFILLIIFINSCDSGGTYLSAYSGGQSELVVVSTKAEWEGVIGEMVKKHFGASQRGLPQPEAKFNVINVEQKSFNTLFRTHRSLMLIKISSELEPKFELKKDAWAKEQLVCSIEAPTEEDAAKLIDEKGNELTFIYHNKELDRLINRNIKFGPKEVNQKIKQKHSLRLSLQKDAYVAVDSTNFAWIRIERERPLGGFKHQISQGILVYYYEYTDTSQFNPTTLLKVRDSITQKYIQGPSEGSYMTVSNKLVLPEYQPVQFKGKYAVEIRGLWRMEKDFMGGPFVSLTTLDEANNRIVTVEGYVFAPEFKKREYTREVEAIIRSLSFN